MIKQFIEKSLNRKLTSTMLLVGLAILVIGGIIIFYSNSIQDKYETELLALNEKQELVLDMDHYIKDTIIHVRGYYAFDDADEERRKAEQAIYSLKNSLDTFSTRTLTREDLDFITEIRVELNLYETNLSEAFGYVESNDRESLTEYAKNRGNVTVDRLMEKFSNYVDEKNDEVHSATQQYINDMHRFVWINIGFIIFVVTILFFSVRGFLRNIGRPLKELTEASVLVTEGKDVIPPTSDRKDELGILTRAFTGMIKALQEKEEELVAQNEELLSQQDELEYQQKQLTLSLEDAEATRHVLTKYNDLISAISVTPNLEELLRESVTHLSDLYEPSQLIYFLTEDHTYETYGVPAHRMKEFFEYYHQGLEQLIIDKKREYIVSREASPFEKGISEQSIMAFDYYIPVYTSNAELIAVFAMTKVGKALTGDEIDELKGLLHQTSIAIERSLLHRQKLLETKLSQDILNNVNEGIQLVSPEGKLLQFNDELCRIITCVDGAVLKDSAFVDWFKLFEEKVEESADLRAFFQQMLVEKGKRQSFQYMTSPDKKMFEVYTEPLEQNGTEIAKIFVHRDITTQNEVDQMKSDLVSTVSHELRTPLSSVLGFTELMLNRELKPERQRKYLETIHKEAMRLTNLINDFLDLQRMESGQQEYKREKVNINEILTEVITRFEPNAPLHQFVIKDSAVATELLADAERIEQLFTNLISNAVKFSPDGGAVELISYNRGANLVIEVHDQGLGIPEEEIPKLFRKFHRIDNGDRRKIGGTGLGLPICKEIIEAHDGNITVRSIVGEGTTFELEFPIKDSMIEEVKLANPYGSGVKPKKVLILEDDKSLAVLLADELKSKGFEVHHFFSPNKALSYLKKQDLDVVVVDLILSDEIDGWMFIKELREDENTKKLPVFISSALDEVQEKSDKYHITQYLRKPYPPHELSDAIVQVLLHGEQQDSDEDN